MPITWIPIDFTVSTVAHSVSGVRVAGTYLCLRSAMWLKIGRLDVELPSDLSDVRGSDRLGDLYVSRHGI